MAIDAPELLDSPERTTAVQEPFPILSRSLNMRGVGSPASIALKERSLSDREHIAAQSFDLRSQQQELNKIKVLADIEKEKLRVQDSMELHRQTMHATKALSELAPDDPQYQRKVLEISTQFPAASKDPIIGKAIAFRDQQLIHQQEMQQALDLHHQTQADAFAGHYGVPTAFLPDGSPDYATMKKAAKEGFTGQAGNAGAGIVAPAGLEVGNIKVDPKGDRSVEFERPLRMPDTLKRFITQTKELGLTFDDFENPGAWKKSPDDPAKVYRAIPGKKKGDPETVITVNSDHFNQLSQDYHSLTSNPVAATVAPVAAQPDMKALAKQAMDDPTASPEHKAAAARILGQ